MTMTLISTYTVGAGGVASIDFTSIPQTYTDLVIKFAIRSTSTDANMMMSFNSTSTGFSSKLLYGTGSSAASASYTDNRAGLMVYSDQTSNVFSNGEIYIPNYISSTAKSWSSDSTQENNGTSSFTFMLAGISTLTSAISRITLTPIANNFAQYSTISLYGILKGSGGATVS